MAIMYCCFISYNELMTYSIRQAIKAILDEHLHAKVPKTIFAEMLHLPKIKTMLQELDNAVTLYNRLRQHQNFPSYVVNARELNSIHQEKLPLFTELSLSKQDIAIIGSLLATHPYFTTVWTIANPSELLCNLVLLVYRTHLLTTHADSLMVGAERRVQISSTIEEMIGLLQLESAQKLFTFTSFSLWYRNWQEEAFSEAFYKKIQHLL